MSEKSVDINNQIQFIVETVQREIARAPSDSEPFKDIDVGNGKTRVLKDALKELGLRATVRTIKTEYRNYYHGEFHFSGLEKITQTNNPRISIVERNHFLVKDPIKQPVEKSFMIRIKPLPSKPSAL